MTPHAPTTIAVDGHPRARAPRPPRRRLRRLAAGAVLILGLVVALPSCRAGSRWNVLRMTPATSELDTASLGEEVEEDPMDSLMADPNLVWNCSAEGLDPELATALRAAAAAWVSESGEPLVINSGARTLRRQAELMADMTQQQLEGMYCRQGYPSYISAILRARRQNRGSLDADGTYAILCERASGYISSHLCGAAVDISPTGCDVGRLRALLDAHGFTTLDERNLGVNCLHATYRDAPRLIVRE